MNTTIRFRALFLTCHVKDQRCSVIAAMEERKNVFAEALESLLASPDVSVGFMLSSEDLSAETLIHLS